MKVAYCLCLCYILCIFCFKDENGKMNAHYLNILKNVVKK